ncbi:MAG: hypothetical protein LBE07_09950 [Gordonia sp. (in: high G+C Gram-positive bacteria)]|nr:hypothetical protein [Gordonia sp. (in: high G+C Gram-positive bacteria)]
MTVPHRDATAPPRSTPPRRRAVVALAVLPLSAAVALTGCSSDDSGTAADSGPCAESSSVDRAGVRPIPVSAAAVTVVDPGSGTPQALTPAPDTTRSQEVTLTTDSLEASIAPDAENKQQVQRTQQNLTTPITARVVCDDPANLEFSIGTPTTLDNALTPELGAIAGSTGGVTFNAGLNPQMLRLLPNEESSSPARSAVEQSLTGALDQSIPLPTQPVGVGARWESVRTVSSAATIRRTTTVTLKSRVGSVLTLAVTVEETPVDSVFRIPGSAQTLTIDRYAMAGSGEVTVDLTRMLPTRGKIVTKGARQLSGDAGAPPLLQQNEYTVSWSPSAS